MIPVAINRNIILQFNIFGSRYKNGKFEIAYHTFILKNTKLFFILRLAKIMLMVMFKFDDGWQKKYQQKQQRYNIFKFRLHLIVLTFTINVSAIFQCKTKSSIRQI